MLVDHVIDMLTRAKAQVGNVPLFVNIGGTQEKWDERRVIHVVPVNDGESRYVKLSTTLKPE